MKKILSKISIIGAAALPVVAFGATEATDTLISIIQDFDRIIKLLIPIVFTLAILAFFWGLMKYIFAQGSEDGKLTQKRL